MREYSIEKTDGCRMEWLNYHHLLYFWTVVREGSVTAASHKLRLAQPTISGQLRALETQLGEKLFRRVGRRLELTELGRVTFRYADEIFAIGRELMDTVRGRPTGRPLRLTLGIADVVPKVIAYRLLEPALSLAEPVQMICREDKPERLLADLAAHKLDLVLQDAPLTGASHIRGFNHLLGDCSLSFFAAPKLAAAYRRKFPQSLRGAPLLLPTDNTVLRRSIEQWLDQHRLQPVVAAEFEDSALMKAFGQRGMGIFPSPSVVADDICRQYGVRRVGTVNEIRERFYAITIERRIKHPAVVAIAAAASGQLFAS